MSHHLSCCCSHMKYFRHLLAQVDLILNATKLLTKIIFHQKFLASSGTCRVFWSQMRQSFVDVFKSIFVKLVACHWSVVKHFLHINNVFCCNRRSWPSSSMFIALRLQMTVVIHLTKALYFLEIWMVLWTSWRRAFVLIEHISFFYHNCLFRYV